MSEHPILFSGAMVRAILAGTKTQTRRVVTLPRSVMDRGPRTELLCFTRGSGEYPGGNPAYTGDQPPGVLVPCLDQTCQRVRCPFGVPGDRLWVREASIIAPADFNDGTGANARDTQGRPRLVQYLATDPDRDASSDFGLKRATPSIHMPRWASRITLEVTGVRVELLQEITEEDARAEGMSAHTYTGIHPDQRVPGPGFDGARLGDQPHRLPFADLWDTINGDRATWASNPWVWVIAFRRVQP